MKTMRQLMIALLLLVSIEGFGASPTITGFSPASGPVGSVVTITGTNLSSETGFTIGGVSAIVVSNTATKIVGLVMPGAATGAISVTTSGGTASGSSNYTVTGTLYPTSQMGPKLVGSGSVSGWGVGGIDSAFQGWSVAISGDGNTALVGGPADSLNVGAVWVYIRYNNGTWVQQGHKLVGTGEVGWGSRQGSGVALSGDGNTAVVGGLDDDNGTGAVWIFTRSGTTWTQQGAKLVASGSNGTSLQGCSVAISADGNTVLVGGYGNGGAWVYTRSGTTWTQQGGKLLGTGAVNPAFGIYQGWSVALSADGNTAMVGSPYDNNNMGAAWIFTRSGTTWTQQGSKLVGTGSVGTYVLQGWSVALSADGNTALLGGIDDNSAGAVWVFTRSGTTWAQQGAKLAAGTGEALGSSVSLSADGNTAVIGAYYDNGGVGALWNFTRSGTTWTEQGVRLIGSGAAGNAGEGGAISLSADGNTVITGGLSDSGGVGAAWIFTDSIFALAGPDQIICKNTTVTMAGHGNGAWTLGSGPPPAYTTITTPSSNTTTVTGFSVAGIYKFAWTGTGFSDTMTVTVDSICGSPGSAGPDQTICGRHPSAQLDATGTGIWTALASNPVTPIIITDSASPTTIITSPNPDLFAGVYGFVWTTGGMRDTMYLTVDSLCSGSAGPDQTICLRQLAFSSDTVTMAATGIGIWSALPNNTQSNTVIYSPSSPTTIIYANPWLAGVYGFVWTTTGGSDTMYVTMDSVDLVLGISVSQPTVCSGSRDSFTATLVSNGINSMSYLWYVNSTLAGSGQTYVDPSVNSGDNIQVVVTSLLGCVDYHLGADTIPVSFTVTNCASVDTVWPGDADANRIVDNNDLLTIGLGYDSTGPVRAVQGIVWQGDPATDWDQNFSIYAPLVNFNNADCNGDGIINADDTLAIVTNFGDTHAKTNNLPGAWRSGIPALYPVITSDTVYNNDTLITNIYLGTGSMPANNIYGLAFTFNYDPLVIDSNYSVFSFIPSWLGTSANSININRNFTTGQIKAAITGIDHTARSGNGQIASFRGVVTTDNINGKNYSYYTNQQYISDITAIDQYGNPIPLNAGVDSNYVAWFVNGIKPLSASTVVNVYPNPAATQVRVSADAVITQITITDILGETVQTVYVNSKRFETIDISSLADGIYSVHVTAQNGTATGKLVVSR